jgi:hypothetical protein
MDRMVTVLGYTTLSSVNQTVANLIALSVPDNVSNILIYGWLHLSASLQICKYA